MALLTVPTPQLQYEPAGPSATLESPVTIRLAAPVHAGGAPATPDGLRKIGAFVYRTLAPGAAEQLWHEAEQSWRPALTDAAALAALTPLALVHQAGPGEPWQGPLVAAGQQDGAGAARYAAAVGGFPRYRVRVLAQFKPEGGEVDSGVSAPSADFQYTAQAERARFAIVLDPPQAHGAGRARLQLKNAALVPTGYLELRAAGAEIEVAQCDAAGQPRAQIVITAAGAIELRPAAGQRVIVHGELQATRLHELP